MNEKDKPTRVININIPALTRVEGEGALDLRIADQRIEEIKLRIFEPPRYFEKFLEGREFHALPDIVARICGICPVAYQMSAVQAIESLFQCDPGPWVKAMRRAMYCGEWIESHALHIHLLAAPDFLGFSNVAEMAKSFPEEVRRGLRLQALGNELIALFGARSVHPIGPCVGGFHHAPAADKVKALVEKLKQAQPDAQALVIWVNNLVQSHLAKHSLAGVSIRNTHIALGDVEEYPMNHGFIVGSDGLAIGLNDFPRYFQESHQSHSTALHSLYQGQPYLVGPLARMNLNHTRLPECVQSILKETNLSLPSYNLFHSIVVRALEIYLAIHEAVRILAAYQLPDSPSKPVQPKAGEAIGCTEAPRGLLWHRYTLDTDGRILSASIVPPTSQNQAHIEHDLRQSLQHYGLGHSDDELRLYSEMVVRNYDPCISCATHFINLTVQRDH